MKIGIIGAGVSGLVTARVLRASGFEVVVFEKASDLGGVWSATRTYPGISTQDDRKSYSFSDFAMPDDFPDHPTGTRVREYLEQYATRNGLDDSIHLQTEVVDAALLGDDSAWRLTVEGPAGRRVEHVDWLVAANGVFSTPHVPDWLGRAEFEAASGVIVTPSQLGDGELLRGRSVVVVGWGKSACDVAAASAAVSRSTTVVARELRWKFPKLIGSRLTFHHLVLTRVGEHIVTAPYRTAFGRLVRIADRPIRRVIRNRLEQRVAKQLGLVELDLLPAAPFSNSNSLVTDGFFEAVADGSLAVRRDVSVAALRLLDGVPAVELSDGSVLPADVVIPATGFDQVVDFFAPGVRARLLDANGELLLHRRILPVTVPRLAFIGWSQSYRSPLTSEVGAVWLAAHLNGTLAMPSPARQVRGAHVYRLTHARAEGVGSAQLPSGSFGELDVMLRDLRSPLPFRAYLRQLLAPIRPSDYAYLLPRGAARVEAPAAQADGRAGTDAEPAVVAAGSALAGAAE